MSLPLQTGTPGTFTDVKQGNINCTVQISNTNPYVDFVNFGPCGAMILFDEMRVYSSGTPVEENLRYSETVDLLMEQGGWQCRPMHVFRRNKWRANNGKAGDKHINFIKPAMVDATGVPMFGRTPFMDKNAAVYSPASISFGYVTSTSLSPLPLIDQGLMTASKADATVGYRFGSVFGNDSGYTFNDDGFQYDQTTAQESAGRLYDYSTFGQGTNNVANAGRNASHVRGYNSGDITGTNTNAAQINDQIMWKNTLVARGNNVGSLEATYPWLPCATYSPAQWPDFQPCTLSGETDDFEVDSIIGKTKVSEYMKYLANVRSLPIGVSGLLPGASYALPTAAMSAATTFNVNANNCSFTEYRVSMPFVSGIYGILADKMFPDLLIGANNIRIEFKLASNNKALWLTMDPCRRVPGTVRDFAPFTGASNGSRRFGQSQALSGFISASLSDAGNTIVPSRAALGCSNAMLYSDFTSISGKCIDTTPIGYSEATSGVIVPGSYIYNSSSAMGEDLATSQPAIDYVRGLMVNATNANVQLASSNDGLAVLTAVTGRPIESGMAFAYTPNSGIFNGIQVYVTITAQATADIGFPAGYDGTYYTDCLGSHGANVAKTINAAPESYLSHCNSKTSGYSLPIYTHLPKPQYMPTATPWSQKAVGTLGAPTIASYCNENAACYGTYLPASVPQTRRCQVGTRLAIQDGIFANNGATAFSIRDLQYIGEQVQLDDISTSAIIQHAATSEIVVWTRGYRSFEANCDTGTQQNIILPIQIGQATALYLVFRPSALLASQDYYSNSFICPFTGLSFSSSSPGGLTESGAPLVLGKATRPPDVGGVYTLNSSLDTQNQGLFSYQLFSGTKQYPLQPIQTVSEMLVEREKSTHSLHNWSWCGTESMGLTHWDSTQSSSTTTGLNFDPFLDLGFFTTFVPVAALDDQTITQNPYFSIAEVDDSGAAHTRVRGIRQSPRSTGTTGSGTTQFVGVLNTFVPPIGTFFLGWDFESWTNHDDLMRTGKFLGQEQLSIRMTGCQLMAAQFPMQPGSAQAINLNIGCTAIVPHVVKLSFVPGGHMLSYY